MRNTKQIGERFTDRAKWLFWALRHPLFALSWVIFDEPYSSVKRRFA